MAGARDEVVHSVVGLAVVEKAAGVVDSTLRAISTLTDRRSSCLRVAMMRTRTPTAVVSMILTGLNCQYDSVCGK